MRSESTFLPSESPLGPLPKGWKLVQLKDITTKIGSGATPKGGSANYLANRTNYALIRSQNVFDRQFTTDGLAYITDKQSEKLSNAAVQKGDILLNITGDGVTFARSCIVPPNILPAAVNQHVSIIRVDSELCEPGFLLSYLTHPAIKPYIESFNAGGSRRAITKGNIESFLVPLPPLPEQKRIAHILGTLDDKIELNRKMNRTLEAMARALFKSWFIDFDPVRAKIEGRAPIGIDEETAALFPDRFVDSELGPIPEGWEVKPLAEMIEIISGGTPRTSVKEYWNGNIPWFSVRDAPAESDVFVIDTERRVTALGIENSSAKIMPAGTTIISARGTVGKLAITGVEMSMNQSCYGIRGADGYADYLTYFLLKDMVERLQQRAHGTVFDTITRKTFQTVTAIKAPRELAIAFEKQVTPLMERIHSNLFESIHLEEVRDVLLPELLQ